MGCTSHSAPGALHASSVTFHTPRTSARAGAFVASGVAGLARRVSSAETPAAKRAAARRTGRQRDMFLLLYRPTNLYNLIDVSPDLRGFYMGGDTYIRFGFHFDAATEAASA